MLKYVLVNFLLILAIGINVSCSLEFDYNPTNVTTTDGNKTICDCGSIDLTNSLYWPWLVKIRSTSLNYVNHCFGVLISSFDILTAGHCVYSPTIGKSSQVTVYFPPIQSKPNRKTKWIKQRVTKFTYDSRLNNTSHDFALLTLTNPVPDHYSPICITSHDLPSYEAIVIGFNNDANRTGDDPLVHQFNVNLMRVEDCEELRLSWLNVSLSAHDDNFTGYDVIEFPMLCGFDVEGSAKSNYTNNCQHNPGEPLIFKSPDNGKWFLLGIVSGTWFNNNINCEQSAPTIYTDASYYAEWIDYNSIDSCINTDFS